MFQTLWDGFRGKINPLLWLINIELFSTFKQNGEFIGIGIRIKYHKEDDHDNSNNS